MVPRSLPSTPRPKATPDPDSERQRRLAAAKRRRQEALPGELVDGFMEVQELLDPKPDVAAIHYSVSEEAWLRAAAQATPLARMPKCTESWWQAADRGLNAPRPPPRQSQLRRQGVLPG
eukprot:7857777-Pyramimonas_sp.AAC.1